MDSRKNGALEELRKLDAMEEPGVEQELSDAAHWREYDSFYVV